MKVYIHQDKETEEIKAFGSIVALCDTLGLKKDRFYSHFGRGSEKNIYETKAFGVIKLEVIRKGPEKK